MASPNPFKDAQTEAHYFLYTSPQNWQQVIGHHIGLAEQEAYRLRDDDFENKRWEGIAANLKGGLDALKLIADKKTDPATIPFEVYQKASHLGQEMKNFPDPSRSPNSPVKSRAAQQFIAEEFPVDLQAPANKKLLGKLENVKFLKMVPALRQALYEFWMKHGDTLKRDLTAGGRMAGRLNDDERYYVHMSLLMPLEDLRRNSASVLFLDTMKHPASSSPLFTANVLNAGAQPRLVIDAMQKTLQDLHFTAMRQQSDREPQYRTIKQEFELMVGPYIHQLQDCREYQLNQRGMAGGRGIP